MSAPARARGIGARSSRWVAVGMPETTGALATALAVLSVYFGGHDRPDGPDLKVLKSRDNTKPVLSHGPPRPRVLPRYLLVTGLPYGAMAGLREASAGFRAKHLGGERFAAILSLYPWCNQRGGPMYMEHQWNFFDDTDVPLLVLLGADDDEADPRSYIDKAKQNAAKGMSVEFTMFPGTTHTSTTHSWATSSS